MVTKFTLKNICRINETSFTPGKHKQSGYMMR